jgi:hypothetical protein
VILGGQCSGLDGVVRGLTVHDVGRCGLAMPWVLRAGAVVDGLGTVYDRVLCVRVIFREGVGDTCFELCKGYIEKVVPFLYA